MEIIAKGDIPVERLFFYLEEYFGVEYLGIKGGELSKEIKIIENIDGECKIVFISYPPQKYLLFIISIFKSKLSHQKLKLYLWGHPISPSNYSVRPDYIEGQSSLIEFLNQHENVRKNMVQKYI